MVQSRATAAALEGTATVSWADGGSSNGNTASAVKTDAAVITDELVIIAAVVDGDNCISENGKAMQMA
jgi:hypothetical protein